MKTKFKYLLLILMLVVLSTACSLIKTIKVEHIGQVKMGNVSDTCLTIEVSVIINNPNFYKLSIQDLNADIYIGNEKFGTVKPCGKIIIEANSTQEYSFCSKVSYNQVISKSLMIFKAISHGTSNFSIKGDMTVGNFFFNFKVPINRAGVVRFTK